jgi:hypothetical protein
VLRRSDRSEQFFDLLLQKHIQANLCRVMLEKRVTQRVARLFGFFRPSDNRKQPVSDFYWNLVGNPLDVLAAIHCLIVESLDPTNSTRLKF